MREIKFRAWDIPAKKIIYFDTYLEAQQYQKDIIKEGNFI